MLNQASFILHGDLEWFLPRRLRGGPVRLSFEDHQSAKHLVESLGIPHVEVGQVLVNGGEVPLSYLPRDGDALEILPPEPGAPIEPPRFLLDNHLGRLAASLRMLGFDSLYRNDFEDDQMAAMLETDARILLTRDRQLLMRKAVQYGYCLRSLQPEEQLAEVARRFRLLPLSAPFTRCLSCNGLLQPVKKAEVLDQLEPKTRLYYNSFARCSQCGQVYWQGSHWEHMNQWIETLK